MKKLITFSLILAMLILPGCGKKDEGATGEAPANEAGTAQTETQNEGAITDITMEEIESLADEINKAEEEGDDAKKQELLAEMQAYLEEIEAASENLE